MQGIRSHPSGPSAQSNFPACSGPRSSNRPARSRIQNRQSKIQNGERAQILQPACQEPNPKSAIQNPKWKAGPNRPTGLPGAESKIGNPKSKMESGPRSSNRPARSRIQNRQSKIQNGERAQIVQPACQELNPKSAI